MESFTNALILEIESLGPLVTLAPGGVVARGERWHRLDVEPFADTDEATDAALRPLLAAAVWAPVSLLYSSTST